MKFNKIINERLLRFNKSLLKNSLAAIILILPILFVASCNTTEERVEEVGGVTAQQVIENPSAYAGKTITVSGDVEEIWSPRAFNMDSGVTIGELLVLGREPFPQVKDRGADTAVLINDIATVKGVVRMLVEADVEREIGWDLSPEIVAEFNAKPVLIAQSVSFKPGVNRTATTTNSLDGNQATTDANGMTSTSADSNGTATGNRDGSTANMDADKNSSGSLITDTGVIVKTKDKNSLAGRNAQFKDARVVRVVGPRTFTVASGNDEIYVMLDDASARGVGTQGKINAGDRVSIKGEFERLNMEEINDIKSNRFRLLTDQERSFLKKTTLFLQANEVSGAN